MPIEIIKRALATAAQAGLTVLLASGVSEDIADVGAWRLAAVAAGEGCCRSPTGRCRPTSVPARPARSLTNRSTHLRAAPRLRSGRSCASGLSDVDALPIGRQLRHLRVPDGTAHLVDHVQRPGQRSHEVTTTYLKDHRQRAGPRPTGGL